MLDREAGTTGGLGLSARQLGSLPYFLVPPNRLVRGRELPGGFDSDTVADAPGTEYLQLYSSCRRCRLLTWSWETDSYIRLC